MFTLREMLHFPKSYFFFTEEYRKKRPANPRIHWVFCPMASVQKMSHNRNIFNGIA